MRSPRRKRSLRREITKDVDREVLIELARRVVYVGSPEHKDVISFAGQPKLRADASICGKKLARDLACRAGCVRLSRWAVSVLPGKEIFRVMCGIRTVVRYMRAGW